MGVKVGLCPIELAPDGLPGKANDCPIIFHPDSSDEPFGLDRWRAWRALDMSTPLDDETRTDELRAVAASITQLIDKVVVVGDVKRLAAAGRIRGFVRKDARDLLTSTA